MEPHRQYRKCYDLMMKLKDNAILHHRIGTAGPRAPVAWLEIPLERSVVWFSDDRIQGCPLVVFLALHDIKTSTSHTYSMRLAMFHYQNEKHYGPWEHWSVQQSLDQFTGEE